MSYLANDDPCVKNPDYAAATRFLRSLPANAVNVYAIHKDGDDPIARTFSKSDEDAPRLTSWLKRAQRKAYNVYFTLNSLSVVFDGRRNKAAESDVDIVYAFHCDADVDKSVPPERFAAAKAELLAKIKASTNPPTILIDSGNGYWLIWFLAEPVKVTGANRLDLKGRNIALRDQFGGDNCQNLDRIMRLPFTLNIPNAAKIARGRVEVPSGIVWDHRELNVYGLNEFAVSEIDRARASFSRTDSAHTDIGSPVPSENVSLASLDPDLVHLIKHGPREDDRKIGDGTRSAQVYYVACRLCRLDWSLSDVLSVLIDPSYVISEHIHDQRQRDPIEQASRTLRSVWETERPIPDAAEDFEE